jgi:hypothetical protein
MTDGGGNASGEYAGQPLKVSCASSTEGLAPLSLCLRLKFKVLTISEMLILLAALLRQAEVVKC